MAPITSTYRTYKAGTAEITTWLVQSARRCGIEIEGSEACQTVSTHTSKGKKGQKVGPASKYMIQVSAFAHLARCIAASEEPKIRLPKRIVLLISKVISLRKEVTESFAKLVKNKASAAIETSNAGHRHFVSVLENVLSILQPDNGQAISEEAKAANLFDSLSIEEPSAEAAAAGASSSAKTTKAPPAAEYDIQQTAEDSIFAILALFKDVNEVRQYVMSLWKDYRSGQLDVMSAAVTTDTAFSLLRHICEYAIESIPSHPDYPSMISLLTAVIDKSGVSGAEYLDWTCIQTANLLSSYEDVLSPGNVPVLKPGHFGIYDPRRDRSKMSDKERHREDVIVLMELLPEFTKLSRTRMHVPAQDELTARLRKMMDANAMEALPMHAIFATQILLDIHHVLREDVSRPFDDLRPTGTRVIATIDEYFKYTRSRRIANWPAQNDKVLRDIQKLAKEWTQEDRVGIATVKGVSNVRTRPYHLLKNHPVLCGLLIFRLNILLNDSGINFCNAWGTAVYPAHLYNAARQSADLSEKLTYPKNGTIWITS